MAIGLKFLFPCQLSARNHSQPLRSTLGSWSRGPLHRQFVTSHLLSRGRQEDLSLSSISFLQRRLGLPFEVFTCSGHIHPRYSAFQLIQRQLIRNLGYICRIPSLLPPNLCPSLEGKPIVFSGSSYAQGERIIIIQGM